MDITLREITRELWHEFYKGLEFDPATFLDEDAFAPHQYDHKKVEQDFLKKSRAVDRKEFIILCQDKVVGNIHLKHIDNEKKECELAIHMMNDTCKNKGYGTQAERLALEYAFEALKMRTVFADAIIKNTRSQHVLEKVGFRQINEDNEYRYYRLDSETWKLQRKDKP